jgi:hypothetical protein
MKKLFILLLTFLLFNNSVYAGVTSVGINNSGTTMKPLPIEFQYDASYEAGDILRLTSGSFTSDILIDQAMVNKETPINTRVLVEKATQPLRYDHIRNEAVLSSDEIPCRIVEGVGLGTLTAMTNVRVAREDVLLYPLDANLLTRQHLNMMDALYIDNFYIETLSETQSNIILEWCAKGGTILINSKPSNNQAYTGFLSGMKNKASLKYNFGQIVNIEDLNAYLSDFKSTYTYPLVNSNNYRSIAKAGINLDKEALRTLVLITIVLSVVGMLLLWMPKLKPKYLLGSYGLLILIVFGVFNFTFTKPLVSTTSIQWSKDQGLKSITFLHGLKGAPLESLISDNNTISLLSQKSEDEESQIIYRHGILENLEGQFDQNLIYKDHIVSGHCTWNGDKTLEKSLLMIGNQLVPIGPITKGQTVNLNYKLSPSQKDVKDYDRQIQLVKSAGWTMDQSLLFNEFQNWYQNSYTFDNDPVFLLGWYNTEGRTDLLVRELSLKGGGLNE